MFLRFGGKEERTIGDPGDQGTNYQSVVSEQTDTDEEDEQQPS